MITNHMAKPTDILYTAFSPLQADGSIFGMSVHPILNVGRRPSAPPIKIKLRSAPLA